MCVCTPLRGDPRALDREITPFNHHSIRRLDSGSLAPHLSTINIYNSTMDSQPQQPALTPNTSAFLSYLASTYDSSANQNGANALNGNIDPRILPSSSYFNLPVPGRDTPQDTPSSKDDSVSPPGQNGVATAPVSDDSDDENAGRRGSGGVSKRKASRSQANHHHEEDDDGELPRDSCLDHADLHAQTPPLIRLMPTKIRSTRRKKGVASPKAVWTRMATQSRK